MYNKDLVKKGVTIKCTSIDEVKELFDAMDWNKNEYHPLFPEYAFKWTPTCYTVGLHASWDAMNAETAEERNLKIIDFSEFKRPRLATLLGVEVGQRFSYNGSAAVYWIGSDGYRYYINVEGNEDSTDNETILADMINHPERIKIPPEWSEDTIQHAKSAMVFNLVWVERPAGNYIYLKDDMQKIVVPHKLFPEVKEGEKVKLSDIVGK